MKHRHNIPKFILLSTVFISFILSLWAILGPRVKGEAYIGDFSSENLNNDWIISDGLSQYNINLPNKVSAEAGTHIVLTNTLPESINDGMRLCIRASMQDISIYVNGVLRNSYRTENFEKAIENLPSSYLLSDLKSDDAGKTIKIEILSKANNSCTLNSVSIGYGNNVWFQLIRSNIPVVISALFLIGFGLIACLGYVAVHRKLMISKSILHLGETMIAVGMWVISESSIRQIIFQSPSYSSVFSYLLMESIGGFVVLYFDEVQNHRYHKLYYAIEIAVVTQLIINTILNFSGLVSYYNTLVFSHLWIAVGIIISLLMVILDIRSKKIKQYALTAIGMLLFLIASMIELISFYLLNFYILGMFISIGLIIMLGFTVLQTLNDEIRKSYEKMTLLEKNSVTAIEAFARALDARDIYTGGHSERVADIAESIAKKVASVYNFSEKDISNIHYIGLVHDIGKIGIPDEILNKPGRLTASEFDLIKNHPIIGERLVNTIDTIPGLSDGILYHHERYDGKGYPYGLKGKNIPTVARILCLADSYDAMTSNRIYRNKLSPELVKKELINNSGTQFDPVLCNALLEIIEFDKNSLQG